MKTILYTLLLLSIIQVQTVYGQCYELADVEVCILMTPKGETYSQSTDPLRQTAYTHSPLVAYNLSLGTNYQSHLDDMPEGRLAPFVKNQTYEVSVTVLTTDPNVFGPHPYVGFEWFEIGHGGAITYNQSEDMFYEFDQNVPSRVFWHYTFEYTPTHQTLNGNKTGWDPDGLVINMFSKDFLGEINTFHSVSALVPVVTTGPVSNNIEIRSTSLTPAMPNLILHDPPGDESYSSFTADIQHCQTIGWETQLSSQAGAWAKVKVGAEVSNSFLGLAEVKTKVYASAQGSFDLTIAQNVSGEMERCISTSSTFSTSADNNAISGERGDVFIGSATLMGMGLAENISYTTEGPEIIKELVIAPLEETSGANLEFAYTESYIKNSEIPRLQSIMNGLDPSSSAYQTAARQKKVWDDVIAYNTALKTNSPVAYKSFTAGSPQNESERVSTTELNNLETTMVIEAGLAAEAGIEIAGNGVSGGVSMKLRTQTGFNSSSSSNTSNTITYHLNDGDQTTSGLGSDKFDIGIIHDGKYGTPAFVLIGGETSCPYEGGYQIDQPKLMYDDETTSTSVFGEIGEDIIVPIRICNDSKYERNYHLKMNDNTNQGLEVIVSTTALNSSSSGHKFSSVPAMGCIDQTLILRQGSTSLTVFEDIEMYLYACSENTTTDGTTITSSVKLNAYFDEAAPAHNSSCEALALPTDGTIMGPYDNSRASAETLEASIAPPGTGCETNDGWCMDDVKIDNSLWFTFIAPSLGSVAISLCDMADFDTQLAVYEVANCTDASAYFLVGANDDGPQSCSTDFDSFLELDELNPGQIYYVLVDGYDGAIGNFTISITDIGIPSSVKDTDVSNAVNVFPNPTTDAFYLNSHIEFNKLELYSINGALILEIDNEEVLNNSKKIELPDGLQAGTYIGRLSSKEEFANFKLSVID